MRMRFTHILLAAPLLAAMPAQAQSFETTASTTIRNGTYGEAERILTRELRSQPNRPEFLLNLAAIYLHTGRADAARALYRRVLSLDEVDMDLASNTSAGSHAIALAGLRRIEGKQVSSR
ncbi:MAG: tetratricopeptide repeat protein [Sphingomonas sp.]